MRIIATTILACASVLASGQTLHTLAMIEQVVDGDTIRVAADGNQHLYGVNAPKGMADGANIATRALEQLIQSWRPLEIEYRGDAGVLLIAPNGQTVNEQLIATGMARNGLGASSPDFPRFDAAQQIAVAHVVGIWAPHAIPASPPQRYAVSPASPASTSSGVTLPSQTYTSPDGTLLATVAARVTETNDTWSRFSWRVSINNTSAAPKQITVVVEFQDRDGFPVDDSVAQRVAVAAGGSQELTGFQLIRAGVAPNVAKVIGKIGEPK